MVAKTRSKATKAKSKAAKTKSKTVKGKRLTRVKYELTPKSGRKRSFTGTLLESLNVGRQRIAIFSVPKGKP
jgi:hypothetical protein